MARSAGREQGRPPWVSRIMQGRLWPGTVATALAVLVPASLGPEWLARGGLAPLAVAAVVGLFVGAPIASAEWRTAVHFFADGPVGRALFALAEVLAIVLVAALAAPVVARLGFTGQALSLLAWLAVTWLVLRLGDVPAAIFGILAVLSSMSGAALALSLSAPWTLVEPTWAGWELWLPGAVVVGLLLSPAGLAQWATGPELPPGSSRVAWATTGVAILVGLAVALRAGARYEASLGASTGDPFASATLGFALVGAASAVVGRRGSDRARWTRAGIGLLATIWFAGAGVAALPLILASVLPGGVAIVLAAVTRFSDGPARYAAAVGSILAIVAAATGPAELPASVGGAAALAVTIVGIFWYVATRAVEKS